MAEHGGNIDEAAKLYGLDRGEIYDLSTGISPIAYDCALPSSAHYQALPLASGLAALCDAARHAYQVPSGAMICAGAGSQALLSALPYLRDVPSLIWCPEPTYNEHRTRWQLARHQVDGGPDCPPQADVIILGQPNNPDGRLWSQEEIAKYLAHVKARGGFLVIDEAFADAYEAASFMAEAGDESLIILRSVGKFYGLAGLRVGFAIGGPLMMEKLTDFIGPWPISGPAQDVACQALRDDAWRQDHQKTLRSLAQDMADILQKAGFTLLAHTPLFITISDPSAHALHHHLAQNGFWTRIYQNHPHLMRFGLLADEEALAKLASVLAQWQN